MEMSVRQHKEAVKLLQHGKSEQVVRATIFGIPCQSRFDWIDEKTIVDLKTCANLDNFIEDAKKYQYGIQFVFYAKMFQEAVQQQLNLSVDPPDIYVIAVEKNFPYRTGTFYVANKNYANFISVIFKAIHRFKECKETGNFPTHYEDTQTLILF
jgi:hypothetical protein